MTKNLNTHYVAKLQKPIRKGFTLIEVLVVMIIIGLLSATALITYSPPPFQDTREQLLTLLDQTNFAQEKALLESTPFGIVFFQQKYMFVTLKDRTWVESSSFESAEIDLSDASLLIDNINIQLPDADYVETIFPQVVFSPSAEMTAFEISIKLYDEPSDQSILFELKTDILGRGSLKEYR